MALGDAVHERASPGSEAEAGEAAFPPSIPQAAR
jgi:hypothetical protein